LSAIANNLWRQREGIAENERTTSHLAPSLCKTASVVTWVAVVLCVLFDSRASDDDGGEMVRWKKEGTEASREEKGNLTLPPRTSEVVALEFREITGAEARFKTPRCQKLGGYFEIVEVGHEEEEGSLPPLCEESDEQCGVNEVVGRDESKRRRIFCKHFKLAQRAPTHRRA